MYSMENLQKARRVRNLHSLVKVTTAIGAIGAMEQVLNLVERVGSFHSHKSLATDVGKADTKRYRTAKLWMQCAGAVERKDTLRRSVSRETFHTLTRSSTGFQHQHCRGRGQ